MARQFNLIPPVCEQAEYHLFQREKVEVQLPELYHKIGMCQSSKLITPPSLAYAGGSHNHPPICCGVLINPYMIDDCNKVI